MTYVPTIDDLSPDLPIVPEAVILSAKYGFPAGTTFEVLPVPTVGERARYARSEWPAGPWHDEPFDKVVWVDAITGLSCMLVRGPMGSWCGYVGVTPEHPWHGVGYTECTRGHKTITQKQALHKFRRARERASSATERRMWQNLVYMTERWYHPKASCGYTHTPEALLTVHGGITYSNYCHGNVCHPHTEGAQPTFWWGFDTAHSTDLMPGMLVLSKQMHVVGQTLFTEHLDYDPLTGALTEFDTDTVYRDVAYCKKEVEQLAAQIAHYAKEVV